MKKGKKIALIAAGCMILVGLVMAAGGLAAARFDVSGLNTVSLETNTYEIEEAFHHISIDGAGSDVPQFELTPTHYTLFFNQRHIYQFLQLFLQYRFIWQLQFIFCNHHRRQCSAHRIFHYFIIF